MSRSIAEAIDRTDGPSGGPTSGLLRAHVAEAGAAITTIEPCFDAIERWCRDLAGSLLCGGRLLAAGNGGSAAHAQHLSSELVGRFRSDRIGYSAIALHGEGSALTAIVNDYGEDQMFARQVVAHGRSGDALALFSTSGQSRNILCAADAGTGIGMHTLAVTGPAPNPLAERCREVVAIPVRSAAAVQEAHQVVVHLLCVAFEDEVERRRMGAEMSARPMGSR